MKRTSMARSSLCLGLALVAVACSDDGDDGADSAGGTGGVPATTGGDAPTSTTGPGDASETGSDSGGTTSDAGSTSSGPGGGPNYGPQICAGMAPPGGTVDPGDDGIVCFYDPDDPNPEKQPVASIEHVVGVLGGKEVMYLRLALDPGFCDNTYGVNALNWEENPPRKHHFEHLTDSDHAEIHLRDGNAESLLHFAVDYLDADPSAASGWGSLGVWGGDGQIFIGDPVHFIDATSSLDRNLNERGYASYTVDSPPTNENYDPAPEAPDWDFRVIYEAWVDTAAFGGSEVAQACIDFIHASPSKEDSNTKVVEPGDCPPGWGCFEVDGCVVPPDDPPPGDGTDTGAGDDSAGSVGTDSSDTNGCVDDPDGLGCRDTEGPAIP